MTDAAVKVFKRGPTKTRKKPTRKRKRRTTQDACSNNTLKKRRTINLISPEQIKNKHIPVKPVSRQILIRDKKLFLILDLDHTLVETVPVSPIATKKSLQYTKSCHKVVMNNRSFYIKFRPHSKELLQNLSKKYVIGFYTQGETEYGLRIKHILDSNNELVLGGVLGQVRVTPPTPNDNHRNKSKSHENIAVKQPDKDVKMYVKTWKHSIPMDMLTIVDDRKDVWPAEQRGHIIQISKYNFLGHLIRKIK
eukprot:UN34824